MFLLVNGEFGSFCVWPDALPTVIPRVDFLYVVRDELAPRRILRKQAEDYCSVAMQDFPPILDPFATTDFDIAAYKLPTPQSPKAIKDYVRSLKPFLGNVEGVSHDSVLNRELVDKYRPDPENA